VSVIFVILQPKLNSSLWADKRIGRWSDGETDRHDEANSQFCIGLANGKIYGEVCH
jgi:hypothetical protein